MKFNITLLIWGFSFTSLEAGFRENNGGDTYGLHMSDLADEMGKFYETRAAEQFKKIVGVEAKEYREKLAAAQINSALRVYLDPVSKKNEVDATNDPESIRIKMSQLNWNQKNGEARVRLTNHEFAGLLYGIRTGRMDAGDKLGRVSKELTDLLKEDEKFWQKLMKIANRDYSSCAVFSYGQIKMLNSNIKIVYENTFDWTEEASFQVSFSEKGYISRGYKTFDQMVEGDSATFLSTVCGPEAGGQIFAGAQFLRIACHTIVEIRKIDKSVKSGYRITEQFGNKPSEKELIRSRAVKLGGNIDQGALIIKTWGESVEHSISKLEGCGSK